MLPNQNSRLQIICFFVLHVILNLNPVFTKGQTILKNETFVLGRILETNSHILSEKRIINIYLPDGYKENDSARYPVVYLLDGAADEDFIHVTGLYQFNNFSWINRVPKSIIVGIANVDRRRDFTYPSKIQEELKRYTTAGHSAKFMSFIEKELQPLIEKTFKTTSDRTLIGQSLAGLFAAEVLLKKPHLFSKYIIISPSLWWDDGSLLKYNVTANSDAMKNISVYVAAGKEGLAPSSIPHVMEVDANLLVEKLQRSKINVYYDYLPLEDHATITHQAVFNALRILHPVIKK